MLDDNLDKAKLQKMIGQARFETPENFYSELEEPIQKNFIIDEERTQGKENAEDRRYDMYIMDGLSRAEVLIIIGFKIVKDKPSLTDMDVANFHQTCKKKGALYGALLNETEIHFYEYSGEKPTAIKEIEPLNHIDVAFETHMTPQKYKEWVIARKYWFIALSLMLILMLSMTLANAQRCRQYGIVKAEVNENGEKIYYLPETTGYDNRITGDMAGERRYCAEKDAVKAGFILAK